MSKASAATSLRVVLLALLVAPPVLLAPRLIHLSPVFESTSALGAKSQSTKAEVADHYGKLALSFERNEGQTDRKVKFLSHGSGYDLFLTNEGAVFNLSQPQRLGIRGQQASSQRREGTTLRLTMVGANQRSRVEGQDQLPGRVNYLAGNDPHKWQCQHSYLPKGALPRDLSKGGPGLLREQRELEYDFVVAPAVMFNRSGSESME
jgi:hypothetical protein